MAMGTKKPTECRVVSCRVGDELRSPEVGPSVMRMLGEGSETAVGLPKLSLSTYMILI